MRISKANSFLIWKTIYSIIIFRLNQTIEAKFTDETLRILQIDNFIHFRIFVKCNINARLWQHIKSQ
jgi:hypothetical protein